MDAAKRSWWNLNEQHPSHSNPHGNKLQNIKSASATIAPPVLIFVSNHISMTPKPSYRRKKRRNWVSSANILVNHCFASKDQKSALKLNLRLCQINIIILESLKHWRTSSTRWLRLQYLELRAMWCLKRTRFIGRLSWKISQMKILHLSKAYDFHSQL